MLPKLSGLEVCKTLRGEGFEAPDHHAHRPRPGDRQGGGPGAGGGRLRHQAVLDPRAAGPGAGHPAPHATGPRSASPATASRTWSWTSRPTGPRRAGEPLDLSPREFELLRYLIERKGETVSRDRLLEDVWGYESYPSTRTVDTHIAKLRAKIGDSGSEPRLHPDHPRRRLQVRRSRREAGARAATGRGSGRAPEPRGRRGGRPAAERRTRAGAVVLVGRPACEPRRVPGRARRRDGRRPRTCRRRRTSVAARRRCSLDADLLPVPTRSQARPATALGPPRSRVARPARARLAVPAGRAAAERRLLDARRRLRERRPGRRGGAGRACAAALRMRGVLGRAGAQERRAGGALRAALEALAAPHGRGAAPGLPRAAQPAARRPSQHARAGGGPRVHPVPRDRRRLLRLRAPRAATGWPWPSAT